MKAANLPSLPFAVSAVILLLVSLAFNLVALGNGTNVTGLQFLWMSASEITSGHLGVLSLPLFLVGLATACIEKRFSIIFSGLSLLLAIDIFRMQSMGGVPIYGFGISLPLLISAAMLLVISSVIVCVKELDDMQREMAVSGSIVLFVFVVGSVAFLSFNDRRNANDIEFSKMNKSGVYIKNGAVCSQEVDQIKLIFASQKLSREEPVEIVNNDSVKPFDSPIKLLDWGFPIVRFGNYDYSYMYVQGEKILRAVRKFGDGSSSINLSKTDFGGEERISLLFRDWSGETVFAEQTWSRDKGTAFYCPDYQEQPSASQEPRAFLMKAFKDAESSVATVAKSKKRIGSLLASQELTIEQDYSFENFNCSSQIGMMTEENYANATKSERYLEAFGRPFNIGSKSYFLSAGSEDTVKSYCPNGSSIFLYDFVEGEKSLSLNISKHVIGSLFQSDFIEIEFKEMANTIDISRSGIIQIEEIMNELIISIFDESSGKAYRVMGTLRRTMDPIREDIIEQLKSAPIENPLQPEKPYEFIPFEVDDVSGEANSSDEGELLPISL